MPDVVELDSYWSSIFVSNITRPFRPRQGCHKPIWCLSKIRIGRSSFETNRDERLFDKLQSSSPVLLWKKQEGKAPHARGAGASTEMRLEMYRHSRGFTWAELNGKYSRCTVENRHVLGPAWLCLYLMVDGKLVIGVHIVNAFLGLSRWHRSKNRHRNRNLLKPLLSQQEMQFARLTWSSFSITDSVFSVINCFLRMSRQFTSITRAWVQARHYNHWTFVKCSP